MKYWMSDTSDNHYIFEAEDDKAAAEYFYNSGDRAYNWGRADKAYFVNRLKGVQNYDNATTTDRR